MRYSHANFMSILARTTRDMWALPLLQATRPLMERMPAAKRYVKRRSCYYPHQGKRERARRRAQIAKGHHEVWEPRP